MMSLHPKKESRFSCKLVALFWWILRFLPFIFYLFYVWGFFKNPTLVDGIVQDCDSFFNSVFAVGLSLEDFFSNFLCLFYDNVVFESLVSIFGVNKIFSFGANWMAYYCIYLVYLELVRIFLDVILFIPRLARKWINMACQND